MNILIDTRPLQNESAVRGIGRYTRELVRSLTSLKTTHRFVTKIEPGMRVDLVHYPYFDFFFPTLPILKPHPTIVTIHDVIPLIFAKHYPRGIRGNIKLLYQRLSLMNVAAVITDSQCSKRDIHQYLHVAHEKITAIPLAASQDIKRPPVTYIREVLKKYALPNEYLLYVGDIGYNKNLPFLLSVLKSMPNVHFVMVGRQVNNTAISEGKQIDSVIAQFGLENRVLRLNTIDTSNNLELCALYAGAKAYIQPSLYEGFGLPVLEAMQCKTPVISSVGGSLPEVCGKAAIYFHPREEQECRAAIEKVWQLSKSERTSLIEVGVQQAESFSWERTAKETLTVYEKFLC